MTDTAKVIEQFEKQIEIEKKAVEMTKKIAEGAESPLVRHLVTGISFDSMKHQNYCQALIDIFSGKKLLVRERVEITKLMEAHIELEKQMIEQLRKIIKETDHPAAKFLLREYAADEKRHHTMVQKLMRHEFREKPPEEILRYLFSDSVISGPR